MRAEMSCRRSSTASAASEIVAVGSAETGSRQTSGSSGNGSFASDLVAAILAQAQAKKDAAARARIARGGRPTPADFAVLRTARRSACCRVSRTRRLRLVRTRARAHRGRGVPRCRSGWRRAMGDHPRALVRLSALDGRELGVEPLDVPRSGGPHPAVEHRAAAAGVALRAARRCCAASRRAPRYPGPAAS